MVGTISWTAPTGYDTFYTRASAQGFYQNDLYNVPNATDDPYDDNFVGTTKTFSTVPGETYYWWVHTKNTSTGAWSTHIQDQFTCPAVKLRGPTLHSAQCTVDPSGTTGTAVLRWEKVQGADRHDFRMREMSAPGDAGPPFNPFPSGCIGDEYASSGILRWCWNGGPTNPDGMVINNLPLSTTNTYTWWVHATIYDPVTSTYIGGFSSTSPASLRFQCLPSGGRPVISSSTPPNIDIGAIRPLISAGWPGQLWWYVDSMYDLDCTVVGGGINFAFEHIVPLGHTGSFRSERRVSSPLETPRLYSTTDFTLSCTPQAATVPPLLPASDSVRIELVPVIEER
jgi:hypothetical protein